MLSFNLIGRLTPVNIHGWLLEQFSGSRTTLGTTFKITGGYPDKGYRKDFNSFFIDFIEAGRNFRCPSQKDSKNCGNYHRSYIKYCFDF
jgi:hypothetical protein